MVFAFIGGDDRQDTIARRARRAPSGRLDMVENGGGEGEGEGKKKKRNSSERKGPTTVVPSRAS